MWNECNLALMHHLHSQRTLPVSRLAASCSQDLYAGMIQVQIAQRSKNGVFMTWSCSCVCLRANCWDHGDGLYWQLRSISFSLWSWMWAQSHVVHMTRKTRAFLRGKLLGMHVQYKRKTHFQCSCCRSGTVLNTLLVPLCVCVCVWLHCVWLVGF